MADVTTPFGFPYPEDTDLVRDGAQDIENLAEGVNDYLAGGFLYAGTVYFTSSGSFLKADPLGTGDIGVRAIRVRMVGGGGGGGGAAITGSGQVAVGASGGGGSYSESFITNIAGLLSSETVTRGAGGPGGAAGANAGTPGGASSFGTLVTTNGGDGGSGSGAFTSNVTTLWGVGATTGGAEGTGDLVIVGGGSGQSYALLNGSNIYAPTPGESMLGRNRSVPFRSGGGNGETGSTFGCGGGAGVNAPNQGTAREGGTGGNGIVIVDVFV